MAWVTGTSTDYLDFLSDLADIISANSGHIVEQSSDLLYFYFEGNSATEKIYGGIQAYGDSVNSRYNFRLFGSASWRSGRTISSQPLTSGNNKSIVYLWNSEIQYWVSINKRRILVSFKVSTVYQQFHIGLLDTTDIAIDKQYPYPSMIAGSSETLLANYSTTGQNAFWNNQSTASSGRLMLPGGRWGTIKSSGDTSDSPSVKCVSRSSGLRSNIITTLNGEYKPDQIYVVDYSSNGIYGAVEGLFRVSGYNNSSENIITVDGSNYIVFQDTYKTTVSDYCCIKME